MSVQTSSPTRSFAIVLFIGDRDQTFESHASAERARSRFILSSLPIRIQPAPDYAPLDTDYAITLLPSRSPAPDALNHSDLNSAHSCVAGSGDDTLTSLPVLGPLMAFTKSIERAGPMSHHIRQSWRAADRLSVSLLPGEAHRRLLSHRRRPSGVPAFIQPTEFTVRRRRCTVRSGPGHVAFCTAAGVALRYMMFIPTWVFLVLVDFRSSGAVLVWLSAAARNTLITWVLLLLLHVRRSGALFQNLRARLTVQINGLLYLDLFRFGPSAAERDVEDVARVLLLLLEFHSSIPIDCLPSVGSVKFMMFVVALYRTAASTDLLVTLV
ncbi:hypothetical protein BD626DRAFT_576198 [Schizophyllum amplum]|uniref:Uncharacterized protein n=1 Tax=Schizophyllum amplum TaxID=97359 RepID=A0A550BU40_9AGAR|nr:hypothetical protein BD626DRAFT_576198 [Auriculariopsis ampla]